MPKITIELTEEQIEAIAKSREHNGIVGPVTITFDTDTVAQFLVQPQNEFKSMKPDWKPWRAEKGGKYYYVDNIGNLYVKADDGDHIDKQHYNTFNYHQTKSEAEHYKLVLEAKDRLRMKMLGLNEGWEPNWTGVDCAEHWKYTIHYAHGHKWESIKTYSYQTCCDYWFSTHEKAKQFIKDCSDDLNLIYNITK
jgi:hypothetical protein